MEHTPITQLKLSNPKQLQQQKALSDRQNKVQDVSDYSTVKLLDSGVSQPKEIILLESPTIPPKVENSKPIQTFQRPQTQLQPVSQSFVESTISQELPQYVPRASRQRARGSIPATKAPRQRRRVNRIRRVNFAARSKSLNSEEGSNETKKKIVVKRARVLRRRQKAENEV